MKRRVVVTGLGVISPNGIGKENCWKAMVGGVSAVRRVDMFDVSMFRTRIAAYSREFNPFELGLSEEEAERMDRYVQFAVVAAQMAVKDARLDFSKINRQRAGVSLANAAPNTWKKSLRG
jgi:3-oxoacyl-(acyl-carrier-protein) synthase